MSRMPQIKSTLLAVVAMVSLLELGCRRSDPATTNVPLLRSFGLQASVSGEDEVQEAIAIANDILAGQTKTHLVAAWKRLERSDPQSLFVFIVQEDGLPLHTVGQTETEARAVFISSQWRKLCTDLFEPYGKTNDIVAALAVIILHEVGHVSKGSEAKIKGFKEMFGSELYLLEKDQMERELAADAFATDALLLCKQRSAAAKSVSERLSHAILAIQMNVDANTYFRYSLSGSPLSWGTKDFWARFADRGYTHPNLSFRFRILAYFIEPIESRRKEVQYYLDMRKMAPEPPRASQKESE